MNHGVGGCDGSNVVSAVGFYTGSTFPSQYAGAFFFGTSSGGACGRCSPSRTATRTGATLFTFGSGLYAVDMKTGPNGDLFYVDIFGGAIHEISYTG
jgi:glucose/arabinose dehydrogenase